MAHPDSVAQNGVARPNLDGGRPVHPAVRACEALVEALTAIADDGCAFEHASRANVAIAKTLHERALRLREKIAPEVHGGYDAAELLARGAA